MVPRSKIFVFGGDYLFVEGAEAPTEVVRNNVVRVLTEKGEWGYPTLHNASRIWTPVLRDNAHSFFALVRRLAQQCRSTMPSGGRIGPA